LRIRLLTYSRRNVLKIKTKVIFSLFFVKSSIDFVFLEYFITTVGAYSFEKSKHFFPDNCMLLKCLSYDMTFFPCVLSRLSV